MGAQIPVNLFWVFLSAGVGTTAYAFRTFQTKQEAKDDKSETHKRLDRIEKKLDSLLERKRT
jgi:Na+/H+ antiporter NhaC